MVVQWLRLHIPNTGDPGSVPGQESRFHITQLRGCMPQLRPGAAKFFKKCRKNDNFLITVLYSLMKKLIKKSLGDESTDERLERIRLLPPKLVDLL